MATGTKAILQQTGRLLKLYNQNIAIKQVDSSPFAVAEFMRDVAVIPAIAAIAILSAKPGESLSLNLLLFATVLGRFVIARFTLRSTLRIVAYTGIHELFTAFALALVLPW